MNPGQIEQVENTGLRVAGIVKRYSGVPVLHGVSLAVCPGDIVGLVGHNGAGKSTLLRILSGATAPDSGIISISGHEQIFGTPADAIKVGIATVYQELSLLENLTVSQNIFLGNEQAKVGILKRSEMRDKARALVADFGLNIDIETKLGQYPVAIRQLLEIAVAIHRDARYLLLDEPTTSLEGRQVDKLLETVHELATERNMGILLVNHKMEELYEVANRVAALVDGELRIDASVDDVSRDDVIAAIVGEESQAIETGKPMKHNKSENISVVPETEQGIKLEVHDLRGPVLNGFSVEAQPGRVLGIYGLVGSGRTEFLRSLVGLEAIDSGTIMLDGKAFSPKGAKHAQNNGVVYLTEERKTDGIVAKLDSGTNVALPILEKHRKFGLLRMSQMKMETNDYIGRLRVRGNTANPVETLSGGNQQKVLLARALIQKPRLLLLDEPTKGVDIGVKAEIHRIIRGLAHEDGLTVVLVSSEEEEIVEVSDDIVIASHGQCSGELLGERQRTAHNLRHAAWSNA